MKFQTYIISGDQDQTEPELVSLLKELGIKSKTNSPDQTFISPQNKYISIDQVRETKNRIYQKPLRENRKLIVIKEAHLLTTQAQNALLKILEEPPEYAVIILIAKDKSALLPTILSRSVIVSPKQQTKREKNASIVGEKLTDQLEEIAGVEDPAGWINSQIKLLHQDLVENIESKSSRNKDTAEAIELFANSKKMIEANVNPKFVLANLIINLEK